MIVRKRYRFTGEVQGVGFRFRARHAASLYGLGGLVENLSDGSVLLELEGEEELLEQALLRIEAGSFIRIENMWVETLPLKGEKSFETR